VTETTIAAVAWAEQAWGRGIRDVSPLPGGWTSTMLLLTADDGGRVVLRLMTKEPWRTHADGLLRRESDVQRLLAPARVVPVPTTIAVDPDGAQAGTPAHLMSWLPGSVELARDDDDFLTGLARLLVDIHAVDPGAARPRAYQSWALPAKRVVPEWSRRPETWKEAFALLEEEPPPYPGTFLHRDFHVGNVLWDGDRVSGVVDWVETSWGPVGLDVAHCTTYLAMLHGPEAGRRFAEIHGRLSGEPADGEEQRYWDVMDVVGYLPDPKKVVQPWRDLGRDVTDELGRERLEEHLATVLRA
jgi:aminoglycoside phosphotransferase (APT) family kinase protein